MAVSVLELRLGRNVYVVASTSMDEPEVISEDGDDKEEIQESSNYVEIQEVVEVVHKTDSSGSTSPTISKIFRKLFPGMGLFAGNIDGIRQNDDGNIYEILLKDGNTEEWRQDKYYNNTADACIPTGNSGFRFIKKFSGRSFFSG